MITLILIVVFGYATFCVGMYYGIKHGKEKGFAIGASVTMDRLREIAKENQAKKAAG